MFDFICSFDDTNNQVSFQLHYTKKRAIMLKEGEFLKDVFATLTPRELRHLVKISVCQDTTHLPLVSFLAKRNGKFYFNPDVNPDDDTCNLAHFKASYMKLNV